mmetsp:Transcript_6297/g.26150  ORF Transcript_6297/g.26150 Transcript_6297/m.26150 type:complete len:406 (+) Transcript_6297:4012-5229(+)
MSSLTLRQKKEREAPWLKCARSLPSCIKAGSNALASCTPPMPIRARSLANASSSMLWTWNSSMTLLRRRSDLRGAAVNTRTRGGSEDSNGEPPSSTDEPLDCRLKLPRPSAPAPRRRGSSRCIELSVLSLRCPRPPGAAAAGLPLPRPRPGCCSVPVSPARPALLALAVWLLCERLPRRPRLRRAPRSESSPLVVLSSPSTRMGTPAALPAPAIEPFSVIETRDPRGGLYRVERARRRFWRRRERNLPLELAASSASSSAALTAAACATFRAALWNFFDEKLDSMEKRLRAVAGRFSNSAKDSTFSGGGSGPGITAEPSPARPSDSVPHQPDAPPAPDAGAAPWAAALEGPADSLPIEVVLPGPNDCPDASRPPLDSAESPRARLTQGASLCAGPRRAAASLARP